MKIIFALIFLLFFSSCYQVGSESVKTNAIYADLKIEGNNSNSVECKATFRVGGELGTYVDLRGNDRVTCNGKTMTRNEAFGIVVYTANVPYQVGGIYTINLHRESEGDYQSSAILPEPVSGMSPSFGTYAKGSPITFTWSKSSNPRDYMEVTLNGSPKSTPSPCPSIKTIRDNSPESGVVGFSDQETIPNPNVQGYCLAKIKFSRMQKGALAAGIQGKITAAQSSEVSIGLN